MLNEFIAVKAFSHVCSDISDGCLAELPCIMLVVEVPLTVKASTL